MKFGHNFQKIKDILDLEAPLKTFKERPQEIAPWVDNELLEMKRARDHYYFRYHNANVSFDGSDDYQKYQKLRAECQSLERKKTIEYFQSKKITDFKNNNLYWQFYSASIKIKSYNSDDFVPIVINHEGKEYSDPT